MTTERLFICECCGNKVDLITVQDNLDFCSECRQELEKYPQDNFFDYPRVEGEYCVYCKNDKNFLPVGEAFVCIDCRNIILDIDEGEYD